jgi:hypothetical protein
MCLLKEIVPQFGIPIFVGSDNRLAFVAEVVKLMSKGLGITWKQHMAYCLWSSGKVECMDCKIAIGKTMPGDPSKMGSITAHNLARD